MNQSCNNPNPFQSPKMEQWLQRQHRRDQKMEHIFHRILYVLARIIATLTLVVIVVALVLEVHHIITNQSYLSDVTEYLHHVLTLVVGLEFVRMLIDTTPASVLEVLMVAITRHVILNQGNPITILVSVVCIAGLFAIRRYLIPKDELGEEMVDTE